MGDRGGTLGAAVRHRRRWRRSSRVVQRAACSTSSESLLPGWADSADSRPTRPSCSLSGMMHASSLRSPSRLARAENESRARWISPPPSTPARPWRYVRRMTQTDEFGEELADFVRRVAELKAARSVPTGDPPDGAGGSDLRTRPRGRPVVALVRAAHHVGTGRRCLIAAQEHQLLKALFQSLPLPVRWWTARRWCAASTRRRPPSPACGRAMRRAVRSAGSSPHADRGAFRSQAAAVARGEGDRSLDVHLQQRPSIPVRADAHRAAPRRRAAQHRPGHPAARRAPDAHRRAPPPRCPTSPRRPATRP